MTFRDPDPANLRGLADWVGQVVIPRTEADRVTVSSLRDDLHRMADAAEAALASPALPDWRAF